MERLVWAAADSYYIWGNAFTVRTTDPRFLEELGAFIGAHRTDSFPEGANDVLYSADCGLEKRLAGGKVAYGVSSLYLEGIRIFRGRDRLEMIGRLLATVRDRVSGFHDGYLRLRAGGVAWDGRAVIMPSSPQPHLPALVALLVQQGAGYIGDEIVHLEPVLRRASGLPLPLLVDTNDLALFPDLGRRPLGRRRGEDFLAATPRHPIPVAELKGATADSPLPVGWIVFPSYEPGAETRLEPAGGADTLFHFAEAGLNLQVWEDRAVLLMKELLETAAVSHLVVGSLDEAAELLVRHAPELIS